MFGAGGMRGVGSGSEASGGGGGGGEATSRASSTLGNSDRNLFIVKWCVHARTSLQHENIYNVAN